MLLARYVDSSSDFLVTTRDEMVQNVVKSHFKIFCFRKTFHGTSVFCTPSCLFVWLGFRLLVAHLTVHPLTAHSVLQSQTKHNCNGKELECNGCVWVHYISLLNSLPFSSQKTTTSNYNILRFQENVKCDGHFFLTYYFSNISDSDRQTKWMKFLATFVGSI